ncbi:MAG: exonuclease SbcCD subunit D [Planctomycetes bacterium]|nr:exonuclease SbcCD subunit D [Planctomycetota bacterium]
MIRFLHSSDWQLGMSRRFLAGEAQERFAAARLDAISAIGALAQRTGAAFVVVAGDVFETNQVSARTLARALDKLATVPVPVYLLPGNHDPLDAGSIYRQAAFQKHCPPHVRVLDDEEPRRVPEVDGVELLGAPWPGKHPAEDLCARALARAPQPAAGLQRILVGHGIVDALDPARERLEAISLAGLESAIALGRCHYVALGDRHSATALGERGVVRYSGSPEPTDFDEIAAGRVLEVELGDEGHAFVCEHAIGTWSFRYLERELTGVEDLRALEQVLREIPAKDRCVAKLALRGALSLEETAALESLLEGLSASYAALLRHERVEALSLRPETLDPRSLALSGYALEAWRGLEAESAGEGEAAAIARDALVLFHRLARESER